MERLGRGFRRSLKWLEIQLRQRNTTAGCVFVSLIALFVTALIWTMLVWALLDAEAGALFHAPVLTGMLAYTSVSLLFYAGVAAFSVPRYRSERPRLWLTYALVTWQLTSTTIAAIAFGAKDTPFGVMLLASFALARCWFPMRILWPGLIASAAMIVGAEVLAQQGLMPYAPLFLRPVETGQPLHPWLDIWMQVIYDLTVLFYSGLMFFLFGLMDRHTRDLADMTRIDALTGLLNRATFMRQFEEELCKQQRTRRPCCVLMCDVDHFKKVNDSYGHPAGDLVLVKMGTLLKSATRFPVDVPARFGGEEFVVLLPETDLDAALVVADRIAAQLRGQVFESDGQRFSVTISIGVAQTLAADAEQALRAADANLYQAKHAGRDRVVASVAA
ncbi:MAG: hypothetical protein K0R03_1146 [Moraxellaceae bacterium]|jgi:diguanylate cyclase (GGDEF)-like protein|nr:hypothetical protein [Moraxellaceae bacterium]